MAILCLYCLIFDRYVLESNHLKKFFDYVQDPNYEVASDATATFKVIVLNFEIAYICFYI